MPTRTAFFINMYSYVVCHALAGISQRRWRYAAIFFIWVEYKIFGENNFLTITEILFNVKEIMCACEIWPTHWNILSCYFDLTRIYLIKSKLEIQYYFFYYFRKSIYEYRTFCIGCSVFTCDNARKINWKISTDCWKV